MPIYNKISLIFVLVVILKIVINNKYTPIIYLLILRTKGAKQMDFRKIEEKWQNIWEQEKRFEVKNHEPNKKNAYILIEFPYPSGKGLHTGHVRSYSALDAVARKKRMQG